MNMQYWQQPQKISCHVAREVLTLSEYDIEIHHIKGKANGRVDALSRRPDYNMGEDDNRDVTVLPNHVFIWANEVSIAEPTPNSSSQNTLFYPSSTTIDHPMYEQNEDVLKPWVDLHHLKNIHGTWYKEVEE